MKPKEFDELVRQKFDQNDFEYNPRHWEQLAEELDGRAKKRSMIMWWWMPLAGIAASVTLAMGVLFLTPRQDVAGRSVAGKGQTIIINKETAQNSVSQPAAMGNLYEAQEAGTPGNKVHTGMRHDRNRTHSQGLSNNENNPKYLFAIRLENAIVEAKGPGRVFDFMNGGKKAVDDKKKKELVINDAVTTFRPDEAARVPKTSIMVAGGINRGSLNSGYVGGATIRRMLNDKLYVESDVAYANNSNSQSIQYLVPVGNAAARHALAAAKTANVEENKTTAPAVTEPEIVKTDDVNYNLGYAQVTPGLGYKVMKKLSVGVGPDFQQMLADNRPATSTVDRNNIQVDPIFDVGFMGKTEYSINKYIKAGVSYRKGVNNIISTSDRYIDRDYLQVQIKCAIFNK